MKSQKEQLHQEMKQKFVIERLLAAGITHSRSGKSIYELDYDRLKEELVLAAFREIDTETSSNGWF